MMTDVGYCNDCKQNTDIVLDHRTGDSICADCGLVLGDHYIDEVSEWRTFSDDNNDKDPNRVGHRTNLLLSNSANLTTTISRPASKNNPNGGGGGCGLPIGRWQSRESQQDKNLLNGFGIISDMAEKLGIVETVKTRAQEIYKNMEEKKCCTERNRGGICAAALVIACREEKTQRTLKEIMSVATVSSMKEIHKAVLHIGRTLGLDTTGSSQATELVRRFCSKLGMKNQEMKAVHEALSKSENFVIRRNPKSILAAIIFLISQLSENKKPLQAIADASEVAMGTVKKSYKDLYPHASRVIPNWYATEEAIKNLRCL
ncbi:hypothetical protein Tsubulata_015173 [Turnera subulata]|uniref:TFIIB-type domain-containing protein n=1 Tax=Turnera subulata TaxID=218843 RepID=A0A9Q0J2L4_9ROSI|nr:hypothetical protein Tsubulata_015173 [Turnera subulata]